MAKRYIYISILIILGAGLIFSSVNYYIEKSHNQFHRSRMIQYQFLNQIRNMANNDITYVRNKFPTIEEIDGMDRNRTHGSNKQLI